MTEPTMNSKISIGTAMFDDQRERGIIKLYVNQPWSTINTNNLKFYIKNFFADAYIRFCYDAVNETLEAVILAPKDMWALCPNGFFLTFDGAVQEMTYEYAMMREILSHPIRDPELIEMLININD